MFGHSSLDKQAGSQSPDDDGSSPQQLAILLTIVGQHARLEGKFEVADSIQIGCEIGGQLNVDGKLVIGDKGAVRANVQTGDAIVQGQYEGNMVASGNVEITATGQATGNIETDSLVIAKGGSFNGKVVKTRKSEREVSLVDLVDEQAGGQEE